MRTDAMENDLQRLNDLFPFTTGLKGEDLAKAISNNWATMDPVDIEEMFTLMAMSVAQRESAVQS